MMEGILLTIVQIGAGCVGACAVSYTHLQDRIYTYSYDPEASIEVTFEAKTGYGISGVFVDARPLKGQELQDAIEAGSVSAVSYTHLDVYKRQVLNMPSQK